MKMTRRALAGLAAVPAILTTTAHAQNPAPAPAKVPGVAGGQFQLAARELAAVKLPRNVEPVFRFEA